ncbi:hypothetical protein LTR09_004299 [Extremus antarcticus]|uniref:Peptidase A1 domain-containing protein n=1 Tax=Extremus antarcticus TaxID=702011 RepID=A0AAJ0GAL8_9PEZI|nr:hypothetical protein LTR09_004299 [Extremus antarcticus]
MSSKDAGAAGGRRVKLVRNAAFLRNGVMAYAKALRKFNIKPTLAGPFDMIDQLAQPSVQPDSQKGKPNRVAPRKLVTKDADGKIGEVSAKDINNDSEYIAQVEVGTPAQAMDLIFDTGSADL